ncbi:restriction endonuclease subunit S [Cardiobacterium hominis]
MQQLPRHAKYKESGLPWVGEIPAHWQTRRNRFLFREVDRRSKYGEETHLSMSQVHGLVPSKGLGRKSLQSENYAGGKLVAEHDLVLNRLKAHLGVFARAKQAGVVSPDYTVFRPKGDVSVQYCESLFKTPMYVGEFRRRTKGIVEGFWRLYTDDFYNVTALLPPPEEQDQIVAYLRVQDAHIARFIKAKRDLIKLLTEQKLRIIDHAVTRGLDASVALKPSGIEWLGEMPEHWDASRLKYCVSRIHAGGTPDTGVDGYWSDSSDGIPWLLIADVTRADRVVNSTKRLTQAGLESKRLAVVPAGAVLYTMYASIGKAAILEIDSAINQAILGLEPKSNLLEAEFLFFWLRSLERHIKNLASTSTQANLNAAKVKALPMFLPPVEEQKLICDWIKSECRIFDDAIARTEEEIKLIREYRDRLIADVVTGQVDVRGWQPGPDDMVDDALLSALGDENEDVTEEEDDDGED